ncbi:MAG: penicillin acylase family protein, partial [Mycobacteriales bacterium]
SSDGTLARSMQVATWGRELETINWILDWNRVDDLAGFAKAVAKVAWNENVMYADADGNIAYWHPGLHPIRTPGVDTRFPSRGDGSQDWQGLMPRERLPHVINPKQGYLANWNGKPSTGWGDTWFGDPTTARPSGFATRLNSITSQLAADSSVSFADLQRIDWQAGASDHRARSLVPVLLKLLGTSGLSDGQRQIRDLLAGWNGAAYGPGAATSEGTLTDASVTDGPAATAFRAVAQTLVGTLLSDIPTPVLLRYDATNTHVFDATPVDNLVLRVLDPSTSSLTAQHDYLAGRTSAHVVRAAVDAAVAQLVARYGADPAKWRARHPRSPVASLTGVIGPSTTMPFEDRGSWIHLVSFPKAAAVGRPSVTPVAAPPALAATGGSVLVPLGALCLLGAGLLVRRRGRG